MTEHRTWIDQAAIEKQKGGNDNRAIGEGIVRILGDVRELALWFVEKVSVGNCVSSMSSVE